MIKSLFLTIIILTFLFSAKDLFAKTDLDININTGYRVDDIKWSIAGIYQGNEINILSELTWSNLEIYQVVLDGKLLIDSIYFRGSIGYGWIFDGDNQDSDYLSSNRTDEFSRSNNNTNKGNVLDISLGGGYNFTFLKERISIIPLVGFSYHQQNLVITDGYQTLDPYGIIGFTGKFDGLNSTYETEWIGGWLGLDFNINVIESFAIMFNFEYHFSSFYAQADWNLRTDFAHPISFEQFAFGQGFNTFISLKFNFTRHWAINTDFHYKYWFTTKGTDKTYFADGSDGSTTLNEVIWSSYAFMFGVSYRL